MTQGEVITMLLSIVGFMLTVLVGLAIKLVSDVTTIKLNMAVMVEKMEQQEKTTERHEVFITEKLKSVS